MENRGIILNPFSMTHEKRAAGPIADSCYD